MRAPSSSKCVSCLLSTSRYVLKTLFLSTTLIDKGDAEQLIPPRYKPHGQGTKPPFINRDAPGVKRQLNLLRSRALDKRYDFLLRPGPWEPKLDGTVDQDLDSLLDGWLGGSKPITILDLSGVPSVVLERLVGSIAVSPSEGERVVRSTSNTDCR